MRASEVNVVVKRMTARLLLALAYLLLAASTAPADAPAPSVGDPVHFFLCRTASGEPFLFGSTFLGGGICVLSFFTTTCEYCVAEIPALVGLLERFPGIRLLLVGVDALTNRAEKVAQYVEPFALVAPVLFDDGAKIAGMYGIDAVPTVIVVDMQQRIAYRKQGYEEGDMEALSGVLVALGAQGDGK